jgi:hypothetical protein
LEAGGSSIRIASYLSIRVASYLKGDIFMKNNKVDAIFQWLWIKIVKTLWGFLGLAGYYRCFFQNDGKSPN